MRRRIRLWMAYLAAIVVAGCSDPTPASTIVGSAALVASVQSDLAPPVVYNTQMRSDLEVPACATESKGLAQIMILQDGTIKALAVINNKGDESVRFGHIHHRLSGQASGPIIWWLTTPVGTNLHLTDRHIEVRNEGVFVANPHFATAAQALSELLSHPGDFYVNFHSDLCPAGFARGFLP